MDRTEQISDKMDKAQRKYFQSSKGRKAKEKYRKSEKGRNAILKYTNSEKGKAARLRYRLSEKHKTNQEVRKTWTKLVDSFLEWQKKNPGGTQEEFLKVVNIRELE